MASPPYNFDTSSPAITADISNYPANEQAFRDTVASAMGGIFDPTTGYMFIQSLTSTQITALVNPPTGMLVFNSTSTALQCNVGTPASPTWKGVTIS